MLADVESPSNRLPTLEKAVSAYKEALLREEDALVQLNVFGKIDCCNCPQNEPLLSLVLYCIDKKPQASIQAPDSDRLLTSIIGNTASRLLLQCKARR